MPRRLLPKSPTPRVKLRMAREQAGWSQIDLGNHLQTSQVTVSRWETGEAVPSPYYRKKLALLFGKTPDDLDLEARIPSRREEIILDPVIAPPPRIPLVGRTQELASLQAHLCTEHDNVTVAISGLPGVGKTTLACTIAHDPMIRASFPDGILWAGLGVHPDLPYHLHRWGTLLGLSMTERGSFHDGNHEKDLVLTVRNAIGTRRMLLILDDAWVLEDALAFQQVGGAQCAMLITTRFPHIATALDGEPLILRELTMDQSLDVLRLLAPQVVKSEAHTMQTLIQMVGGLPLALTLMGNYLRQQGMSGQTRRVHAALHHVQSLEARFHLSEPRTHIDHHPSLSDAQPLSLHAVIAVTDEQLPASTRATLYALSVFPAKPESFSEEAALAVAACSIKALDTLLDMGLLEGIGDKRYSIHQTIADYARLHLDHQYPQEHLITYALTLLEQHPFDYEVLAQERCILIQALEVASVLGKQRELVQGVTAFIPYLLRYGKYVEAQQYLVRAQQAAQVLQDHIGMVHILLHLGDLAGRQGDYTQSCMVLQEALVLARRQDDTEVICAVLSLLGRAHWKQGNYSLATPVLQEGLVLARQMGHTRRICELLDLLGAVVERMGDYAQAEVYFQEGLTLARELGDQGEICRLTSGLGVTYGIWGERARAEEFLHEALSIAQQIGYHELACVAFSNLGEVTRVLQHDYTQAEALFLEGLALARTMGMREWICALLINLTELEIDRGNPQQAYVYLKEGMAESATLNLPRVTVFLLFWRGILALGEGRLAEAEALFFETQQALPSNDMELQACVHYGQAQLAAKKGQFQQAYLLGEASAVALERAGHYLFREVRRWLGTLPQLMGAQEGEVSDRCAREGKRVE